jgi:GTP cyclohydrolase II
MSNSLRQFQRLIDGSREPARNTDGAPDGQVRVVAAANLPTRFGNFCIVGFTIGSDGKEHVAFVNGDVVGGEDVPTRVHSECLTGDVACSLRCDCREQLELALSRIASLERGIVLYLRQEGRGIGLLNKIRAYSLQDGGLDTVDANVALGFRDDERDYTVAANMLAALDVRSIQLMTNNPRKREALEALGVTISARIPHRVASNPHNAAYLQTKALRSGHDLEPSEPALRPVLRVARRRRAFVKSS